MFSNDCYTVIFISKPFDINLLGYTFSWRETIINLMIDFFKQDKTIHSNVILLADGKK